MSQPFLFSHLKTEMNTKGLGWRRPKGACFAPLFIRRPLSPLVVRWILEAFRLKPDPTAPTAAGRVVTNGSCLLDLGRCPGEDKATTILARTEGLRSMSLSLAEVPLFFFPSSPLFGLFGKTSSPLPS